MGFSAPRLTIYALLSSVEEDLRAILVDNLVNVGSARELLGEDLLVAALERHSREDSSNGGPPTLTTLLPFCDFADLVQLAARHKGRMPKHISDHVKSQLAQIELLIPIRNRIAHIRPFRYDDLTRITVFTDGVSANHPTLWPSVTETIARLARDPSFVFDLPQPIYEDSPGSAFHNLPLPEFDDTGFLGRDAEVRTVLDLCKGSWPVISLVGEGGLGKTALALRCAYDILDDPGSDFDAVIWSSSKTTRLDATQIRSIDGAIRDSMGLFAEVASAIGAPSSETDPLDEILSFLRTFKVLLILDNLETILDAKVRSFLGRLPPGSKVLITSRIGLGEFEYRVNLHPLPNPDATRLLRAVAKVSGVRSLATMSDSALADMCERMTNNPLFIKWFVSSVQAGSNPNDALVDPGLFLDFCMSNVHEHLSDAARSLLKALLSSPNELSLPELVYFNDDDAHQTQGAVQELLTTNMLAMNTKPAINGGVIENRYRLTDLARLYLTKHHPLTVEEDQRLERSRRKLEQDQRLVAHEISGDPFERRTLVTRSRNDLLVARPLLDAIRLLTARRIAESLEAVEIGKSIAPDYYECYRVEAQIYALAGNVALADAAFQTALDLNSQSAPLHYFYASFLRATRHDPDRALEQLVLADSIASNESTIMLERVRCLLETLTFVEARDILDDLILRRSLSSQAVRNIWLLDVEYWVSLSHFHVQTRNYLDAIAALEGLQRDIEVAPHWVFSSVKRSLSSSAGGAWCCAEESDDEGIHERAEVYLRWLRSLKGLRLTYTVSLSSDVGFGQVRFTDQAKEYGFIGTTEHGDLYFRRSYMSAASDFGLLKPGTHVSYRLSATERGRYASQVTLI